MSDISKHPPIITPKSEESKKLNVDELGTRNIALFNIVLEAKARAMVQMTKKMRPDLKTSEEIEAFLRDAIHYGVEKEK